MWGQAHSTGRMEDSIQCTTLGRRGRSYSEAAKKKKSSEDSSFGDIEALFTGAMG